MLKLTLRKIFSFTTLAVLCLWLSGFVTTAKEPSDKLNARAAEQIIADETTARDLGAQWNGASVKSSISLYLSAADDWKKIGNYEKASDCLREVSHFDIFLLGDNEKAVTRLRKTLKLDSRHQNLSKKTKTFSLLAIAYLRLGNFAEARKFSEKATITSRLTNDTDARAEAFFTKAQINYDANEFDEAIINYEKALDFWRQSGNLGGQAKALIELAYGYMTNDEVVIGLQKAQESFNLSGEINDLRLKIIAQNAVGVLKSKLGEKQEALNILLQSEKQFPDDVDFLEKGIILNHLADIYYDYGEYQVALNYYQKAFELFQKEGNPFAQLATLSKLGILTFRSGDEAQGLEYFNTGFQLARKFRNEYFPALLNQDLGNLYFEKDKTKALTYFKRAEESFEKLKIRTHVALIKSKIGSIYQTQGKNELAGEYFDSSLRLNRETKNRLAESQNLFNLAHLSAAEKNEEQALQLIKQSIEITESLSSDVFNTKLKSAYFSNVYDRYELYMSLLMKLHHRFPDENYQIQALQAAEKSRARSMLENFLLSEASFTKDVDAETIKREKEIRVLLTAKADKLTDLLSGNADKSQIEEISTEIKKLEHQLEEIKTKLKRSSPLYSAIRNPAPFDVVEFQNNVLDENTQLLEFSFGKNESYLWIIGKREININVLPPGEQIEGRVAKLRQLLGQRALSLNETIENYQARMALAESEFEREAQILSNDLFGQAAKKIAGKRLIIVADGKLHYFPVAALPFPGSAGSAPFLLSNEIVYAPSASMLNLLKKNQNRQAAPRKNLLVFADPIFSAADERVAGNDKTTIAETPSQAAAGSFRFAESLGSLPRLFESEKEARSIAEIVGISESEVFSGAQANLEKVLNPETADYKIIHFATHGYLNEERPELSAIVLSQFNERGEKLDGLLRLHDIYSLNLNSDLVVLSACETGAGKEVKGEGLMSLNNAFLQVGAKAVLSSLWKVDDNATKELMKHFYQGLAAEKLTASQALRQAQIKLSQNPQYKSPFFWAAFTFQGDFQNKPQLSGDNGYKIYFLMLVPLLILGVYLFRKGRLFNRQIIGDR